MTDVTNIPAGVNVPEALPCPFCGGIPFQRRFAHTVYIECRECGATTTGRTSLEAVLALWNVRTPAKP
jgi:Lar family restriction alleviation protein